MKVNLSDIDAVVTSHGHWDHTAATVDIVSQTGGVKVYSHTLAFDPRFFVDKKEMMRSNGVPEGQGFVEIETAEEMLLQRGGT